MPDKSIAYGQALYYPYINFRDINWIKIAALYYTKLNRIVPKDFSLDDDHSIIKELNDKEDFIKNIDPSSEAEAVTDDFIEYAINELSDYQRRQALIERLGTIIPEDASFSIHSQKLGNRLKQRLPQTGLAFKNELSGYEDWYEFEPTTGAIYMTFLANYLARNRNLPVVTDNSIYQPLINNTLIHSKDNSGVMDMGEMLAAMVIQTSIPENIKDVPISKIIEFRRSNDEPRHMFYQSINELVKGMDGINNPDVLKECLQFKLKSVEIAVKNLEASMRGVKISTANTLFSISIPVVASIFGSVGAALGLSILAVGKLLYQGVESSKVKSSNPFSYVLSLKEGLTAQSFITELNKGKLIL